MTVRERINLGESENQEFKESARWSYQTENKRKSEQIIVKPIAGFLNRNGGSLFIGVKDDCSILGLDDDYATLTKSNKDGFELYLSQLFTNSISGNPNSYCKILFHEIDGLEICEIVVNSCNQPVFTNASEDVKSLTDFWVREGNRTIKYFGEQQQRYIDDNWI